MLQSGKKPIYKLGPPKKSLAVRLNFGRVQKKVSCKATGGSPSPKLSQAPGTSRQGEPFPLVTRKPRSSTVRRPRLTVAPFNEKRVPDPAQASEPEGNDFLYILAQAGESLERDEKASEDRAGFCPPARPDKAGKLKFKEAKWKPKERFTTPPVGALTKSPDMQKIPATVNPKCTPEIPSNCKFVKPVKPQVKPTGKPPFKVTCSKPPSLCPVDPKNEAGKTIMMPQKNQTAQDKAAPHSAQANRAAHKAAATAAQPNPPPKPYSGASLKTQTGTPFKSQASAPIKTQPSTPTKTLSRTSSDSQMNTLPKKPLTRQPTIVAQTSERSKQTSDSSGESDEKRKATSMTRPSQTVAAIKTTVSSAEKSQELLDLKPIVPTSRGVRCLFFDGFCA